MVDVNENDNVGKNKQIISLKI